MRADPQEPETFEDPGQSDELAYEAPEADAAEQRTELRPHRDTDPPPADDSADPADAAEQARVVVLNEDDYEDGGEGYG